MSDIKFINDQSGAFRLKDVNRYKNLYFPLTNPLGMMSSITPNLNGDNKIDQNHFSLIPVSEIDLKNSLFGRNVWFNINDDIKWALNGNSVYQYQNKDLVDVEAGFLYHQVKRSASQFNVQTTSFVVIDDYVELHKIVFTNASVESLNVKPTIAIPIYGRSADNLRDHRHVTSLLNRAYICENGIISRPTLSFDERGHTLNDCSYGVFGMISQSKISKYWPIMEEFTGEGNLFSPDCISKSVINNHKVHDQISGYEIIAGIEFEELTIKPNESFDLYIAIVIDKSNQAVQTMSLKYLNEFNECFEKQKDYWNKLLSKLTFNVVNNDYSHWLKWVSLQPILRRIYGCSFMPHHDYGRGGRGWRDLWQDQLALILMNDDNVKETLFNNFAGVRVDGSNATIISHKPGEFIADRNEITRVWSDHAAWPLFTTKLYIDFSGDIDFLFRKQTYFKDKFTHYTKNRLTEVIDDNFQRDKNQLISTGSILEHLLIQNIIPFFNVGKHGNIRLEDGDWNDGMDMASDNGETIAFTAFYAQNLKTLANILKYLLTKNIKEVELLDEIKLLLYTDINQNPTLKNEILSTYFNNVSKTLTGNKCLISVLDLTRILESMSEYLAHNINKNEWIEKGEFGWFNGYYDNDAIKLDSKENDHIGLTAQVFTLMGNISTNERAKKQIKAIDNYLYNANIGGYCLNTDYNEIKNNMGRMFGFAYGHKENGAVFSHMAMMYANALYKHNLIDAADKVISSIYHQANNTQGAMIYPGIPEYFNSQGRGMYHYLTGSASWLIMTFVTEVFGIKGYFGDLVLEPKLKKYQFINQQATVKKMIKSNLVRITYINKYDLDYSEYKIIEVIVDGKIESYQNFNKGIILNINPKESIDIILSYK